MISYIMQLEDLSAITSL